VLTGGSILTHTQLGALIGAYLGFGALFAIPGGWFGKRFGDKRVVLVGLAMMTLGGALLAASQAYEVMLFGRLVSGLGAVLLNVLVTKMVTDWFAGDRITTAMGVLISSWPFGIALALLTVAPLEALFGLGFAFAVAVGLCALALLLVAVIYGDPPEAVAAAAEPTASAPSKLSGNELTGVILCGSVWCLYNVALILPLSFGPEYLVTRGLTLASAGATVSLTSWLIIPALPLGAMLAERLARPFATMVVTFLAIALLTFAIPFTSSYVLLFAALGIVFGPAGGLIMALPARVLGKHNRAIGMGIFFAIYYAGMGIFPALAGYAVDVTQDPAAPIFLAGVAILLALIALAAFRALQAGQAKAAG
jgi:MFS family permease